MTDGFHDLLGVVLLLVIRPHGVVLVSLRIDVFVNEGCLSFSISIMILIMMVAYPSEDAVVLEVGNIDVFHFMQLREGWLRLDGAEVSVSLLKLILSFVEHLDEVR